MCTSINKCFYIYSFVVIILLIGCKENKSIYFETLNQQQTGLTFNNKLTSYPDFNMFKYMYFFNGAGVGAGDFNNDGLIDLYFASNQGKNKLFLSKIVRSKNFQVLYCFDNHPKFLPIVFLFQLYYQDLYILISLYFQLP